MAINVSSKKYAATKVSQQRAELRGKFWPGEDKIWLGPAETGYFCSPRTLPLLLALLRRPEISGKVDPSSVYIELLSRHMGEGIVEMSMETDHAYCAGYKGPRAARTWGKRMKVLEEAGFIKVRKKGNREFGYVLLIHPSVVVDNLSKRKEFEIPEEWWTLFGERQMKAKERTVEQLVQAANS